MNQAIGESITFAIGVAISPMPIVAVILMLLSKKSASNSVAFLLGWIIGIAAALAIVITLGNALNLSDGSDTSTNSTSGVRIALGVGLIFVGLRRIREKPEEGEEPEPPKWLGRVENINAGGAVGLGIALAAVNPKNLMLIVGGGMAIAQTAATSTQKAVAGIVFTIVGSITIIAPVVAYFAAKTKATPLLATWRDWLTLHARAVVGAILLVIGVLLIGKGIGPL